MTPRNWRLLLVRDLRLNAIRRLIVLLSLISTVSTCSVFGQSPREVSLYITVTDDRAGVAAGLKREWFNITENKAPLQITGFETSGEAASVAVLIDLSNSVSVYSKKAYIQAVSRLIKTANVKNDYLIVAFNREIKVIADWGTDYHNIEKQLTDAAQLPAKDDTVFYDACSFALTKLATSKHPVRAMIILSDGQDNASKLTFVRLRDQIKESSAIVYAVGAIPRVNDGSALNLEGRGILDELSSVAGGNSYYPNSANEMLLFVSDQIPLELGHLYRITFKPPSPMPDNKWHTIKVKLSLPDKDDKGKKFGRMNVRSRLGYYDR